jgi:mannosyltransferase OCH1-like enzyme
MNKEIIYCYFGDQSINYSNEYIDSWRKFGYNTFIINEKNFDFTKNNYAKAAYENDKFAFVSDVARLKYLYDNGGIYCDTDVRMIKDIDPFINTNKLILSFEYYEWELTGVNLGTIITPAKNPIIKKVLDIYESIEFYPNNENKTINYYFNKVLEENGLIMNDEAQEFDDFKVFPSNTFCRMTKESYLVHEYSGSWKSDASFLLKTRRFIGKMIKKVVGKGAFNKIWKS